MHAIRLAPGMLFLSLLACGESGANGPGAGGTAAGGSSGEATAGGSAGSSGGGSESATGGQATAGAPGGGTASVGGASGASGSSGAGSGGGGGASTCAAGEFAWPNGALAAVSLTYDDSLASQLDYAVPVLDANGIFGTFFLSGNLQALGTRFGELIPEGHELASHTVKHPCNDDLTAYTEQSMAQELDDGVAAIRALGQQGELTFAYPCGQNSFGSPATSYEPLVAERFAAARGTTWAVADPKTVNLFAVPSAFPPTTSDGSDFIALVQQAVGSGGWAVLGVHGVSAAGEYLQLNQPAHDAIVQYLKDNASEIWTAPFGRVAAHVAACR